jgi:hypothetical protein
MDICRRGTRNRDAPSPIRDHRPPARTAERVSRHRPVNGRMSHSRSIAFVPMHHESSVTINGFVPRHPLRPITTGRLATRFPCRTLCAAITAGLLLLICGGVSAQAAGCTDTFVA